MTPTIIPQFITTNPFQQTWRLVRNDARAISPLGGTFQDIIRQGTRWEVDFSWKTLSQVNSQRMEAWAAQMAKGGSRCYLPDFSFTPQGSFGAVELITNGSNLTATTSWAAQSSAVLSVNGGCLKITNGAASAGGASWTLSGLTIGASYVVRTVLLSIGSTQHAQILIGTSAGGNQTQTNTYTAGGYLYTTFVATATTHYLTLVTNTTTAGDYTFWQSISCLKAPIIDGASQTGNSLLINGLAASTNGIIAMGDLVELASGQVVRAIADMDSNASGVATLFFEPSLRSSPANASGIRLLTPSVAMAFKKASASKSATPPYFGSFAFSLQEDILL